MKLQTQIPIKAQQYDAIDYDSKLLLLGSCFSEHIGEKFKYFKFQTAVNPFGILFHPLAIENSITRSINKDYYTADELCYHNEQWSSLEVHSRLNQTSSHQLLETLNAQIDEMYKQLLNASHVIITLGTSWVYRHIESDTIVANCQKLPQKKFLKELLTVDEISASLQSVVSLIRNLNPKVVFLFTVSPVRHLKDGFVENTLSKAHLLSAVHEVIDPRKQIYYVPSYEIMMDELRDYRFYTTDMIHPNTLAIEYIWDKFKAMWISSKALKTLEAVTSIQNKKAHRPFNPNSEAHQNFLKKLDLEIEELRLKYPHIYFQ
ncbi:GSCFA domain-containing protein [Winogradskyella sediminis]|uniref:GSCFA domain-containing protein n=1 Tax=Winogradskyella sediminis TaxID=1382466 RepID=UPI003AA8612F